MKTIQSITNLPEWHALQAHKLEMANIHLRDLFNADADRFNKFSLRNDSLLFDYSKNHITQKTITLFSHLADKLKLGDHIAALFSGKHMNASENRLVLHTALRNLNGSPVLVNGENISIAVKATLEKMVAFTESLRAGKWLGYSHKKITDVVNIGIGGSHLGPALVAEALLSYADTNIQVHFVSDVDGALIEQTLKKLNPETTLFIVSSKSFSTIETLTNAKTARQWFIKHAGSNVKLDQHFIAATGQTSKALEFGIPSANFFPIWDWIGGRYSLWSTVGLPIMLLIGAENFHQMLAGAYAMDEHFASAPFAQNMPVLLAFLEIWYVNFYDAQARAVLPYDYSLRQLPAYLQQLQMESLGKSTTHHGAKADYATGPIIFGKAGTDAQHSFCQLLHQGTLLIPTDFIACARSHDSLSHHHAILLANMIGQSRALMEGRDEAQALVELTAQGYSAEEAQKLAPSRILAGNQPSNTILLSQLTPYTLGALLALYEQKTFVESVIWQINAFDQWGVELGKQLAEGILVELNNGKVTKIQDSSTEGLINYCEHRVD